MVFLSLPKIISKLGETFFKHWSTQDTHFGKRSLASYNYCWWSGSQWPFLPPREKFSELGSTMLEIMLIVSANKFLKKMGRECVQLWHVRIMQKPILIQRVLGTSCIGTTWQYMHNSSKSSHRRNRIPSLLSIKNIGLPIPQEVQPQTLIPHGHGVSQATKDHYGFELGRLQIIHFHI